MSRVFNFEGPVFSSLSRLADLFCLNLLFIVCCIPVVTIGAATTALYYVTLKMVKDEEGYITRSFFRSFKRNFAQATVIWAMFLFIATVLMFDFRIAGATDGSMRNVIVVAVFVMVIIAAMVLTYVFPILSKFDNTVKNTVKNAFLISIRHLPYTILMIIISIVPVVLIWFFPALLILVLIMFSAVAYINSKFLIKIFTLYMPKQDTDAAEEGNGEV